MITSLRPMSFLQVNEKLGKGNIMGRPALVRRLAIGFLICLLTYFIVMDVLMYLRVQRYNLKQERYNKSVNTNCAFSPLCHVRVKSLMMDHPNHYILGPAANEVNNVLGIYKISFITPNMISIFHVFIAIGAAKCVASSDLVTRRIGVLLFEIRTFFDALDGSVARKRKNIEGDLSEIGSVGFVVDGVCDGLGCIAIIIGCLVFLKQNPPRRGISQSLVLFLMVSDPKDPDANIIYKEKIVFKRVIRKFLCFGIQLVLISTAWNRYIALYQDLLERKNIADDQMELQEQTIKSNVTWVVTWLWRLCNFHFSIELFLLSIFLNKLWEFLCIVQYIGFVILLCLVCVTEMHVLDAQATIFKSLINNTTS